jgi:uncharacterized membrane protein
MIKNKSLFLRNCFSWLLRDQIALFTALVIFAWGIALIIIIPPFQSPDEPQHTYRAWDMSNGNILCQRTDYRISVPRFLESVQNNFPREQVQFSTLAITQQKNTAYSAAHAETSLIYSQFCAYNPIGYLPTTIGAITAKIFNFNAIVSIILMRFSNLLFATCILYIAIRIMPFAKILLSAIALLPMLVFQFSTTSSDAVAIPLLFLYTSVLLWGKNQKSLSIKQLLLFSVLSLITVHAKPGYSIFIGLLFLLHQKQFKTALTHKIWLVITLLFNAFLFIYLSKLATINGYYDGYYKNIEPAQQLLFIFQNPLQFITLILRDGTLNAWVYVNQIVGYFGWLTIQLRSAAVIFAVMLFMGLYVKWNEPVIITKRDRMILGLTGILGMISLYVIAYVAWTAYQNTTICCLQGRYFIPYIWLLLLTFWQVSWSKKTMILCFITGISLLIAESIYSLMSAHY